MRLRRKKNVAPNYIVIVPSADGQWFFKEIDGGNNKTLSVSETYSRKADCKRGAKNAFPDAEIRMVEVQ